MSAYCMGSSPQPQSKVSAATAAHTPSSADAASPPPPPPPPLALPVDLDSIEQTHQAAQLQQQSMNIDIRLHDSDEDDDDGGDSSDEEYNQRNFGIYQALPVYGEPDWSLSEPDTAEEYLRRVRYEAARCPKVVRVEPAPEASSSSSGPCVLLPAPEAIPDAPDWAKPNRSWVQQFVSDFQQLRGQVQDTYQQQVYSTDRVPHMNDVEAWDRVCFGRGAESDLQLPPLLADDSAEMTQLSPNICSKIMALEQPDVISLFLRHTNQLEEVCPSSLPLRRAQWLFALAARLEKPCHPEVAAAFRAVLRHCCKLRSAVSAASDPMLPKLNVLIVMAGAYFAQDEQLCCIVDSSELL